MHYLTLFFEQVHELQTYSNHQEETKPSLATRKKIKTLELSKEIEKERFEFYSANKRFRKNPTKENKIELQKAAKKMNIREFKNLFLGTKHIYETMSI